MRIAPLYFRLFDALLEILDKAGFLVVAGNAITTTGKVADSELKKSLNSLQHRKLQLIETYPEVEAHVNLLWECGQRYEAILKGEERATDVIFPGSSMRLVEGVYRGNVTADLCNTQVAASVAAYIRASLSRLGPNEKIKILEVGAGTGGTSTAVLQAVSAYSSQVEYVYSDLSTGFTQHGKRKFGALYPFAEFKVLNIENDVGRQGFQPGTFDVVIAANVLHATRDLRSTLRNTKALLKSNGWLVLNEVTDVQDFTTLTFGLLDGWWLFDDAEVRLPNAPLLSPNLWDKLLKEEGFKSVHILRDEMHDDHRLGQHVICAESDGQVRQRAASKKETVVDIATRRPSNRSTASATHARTFTPVASPSAPEPTWGTSQSTTSNSQSVVAESDQQVLLDRVEQKIVGCVADALTMSTGEIDPERQFSEYGVDSIIGVDLINVINESLGLTLRTTALFDYGNVKDLAHFICTEHEPRLDGSHASDHHNPSVIGDVAIGPSFGDSDSELILLEKLAGGELGTEQVYQLLEASYGHPQN